MISLSILTFFAYETDFHNCSEVKSDSIFSSFSSEKSVEFRSFLMYIKTPPPCPSLSLRYKL